VTWSTEPVGDTKGNSDDGADIRTDLDAGADIKTDLDAGADIRTDLLPPDSSLPDPSDFGERSC